MQFLSFHSIDKHILNFYPIKAKWKWVKVLLYLLIFVSHIAYSQTERITKNNYTGDWEDSQSWEPVWATPLKSKINVDIIVNGFISCQGPLEFAQVYDKTFTVNDTLIVYGDMTLTNQSILKLNNNGILIIYGDLITNNITSFEIAPNAYLVITGNYIKTGSGVQGSFVSDNEPSNVFIGGTVSVPSGLDYENDYMVLNCSSDISYSNSNCSYGNTDDLIEDPIYSIIQSTCVKPLTPTILPLGATTLCQGQSVTLTSSECVSYLWSTSETTQSIVVEEPGNYSVRVTNNHGCISDESAPIDVTVNDLPVVFPGEDKSIVHGTIISLTDATVTGEGPFTYLWSPQDLLEDASILNPTTKNLTQSAIFTLTATSITTSCSHSDALTVTVTGSALSVIIVASTQEICTGDEVQLYALASGGTGDYTYSWTSDPVGFTSTEETPTLIPLMSTLYSVIVNDGFNSVQAEVYIIVNPLPIVTAPVDDFVCKGDNYTLVASGNADTYLWDNGITDGVEFTPMQTKSYTVTGTITETGCQSTNQVTITVNPLPVVTAPPNDSICEGDNYTLIAIGNANTYNWDNGISDGVEFSPTVTKTYTVTGRITDTGCQSNDVVTINVKPLPIPTISTDDNLAICEGEAINVAFTTDISGDSYQWLLNGNPILDARSNSYTAMSVGDYSVEVTTDGCSGVSNSQSVSSIPLPLVTAPSDFSVCFGESVTLEGQGTADNYQWDNGVVDGIGFTVTQTTTYTLTGTSTASGCHNIDMVIITVNPLPTPTINITNTSGEEITTDIICDGDEAILTAFGAESYSWSTGANTSQITIGVEGIFSVIATDANGCKGEAQVNISVISPTAFAGNSDEVCGLEYQLNASFSNGIGSWSVSSVDENVSFTPNQSDPHATIMVNRYGSYHLTWTVMEQSCQVSSDVTITFLEIPDAIAGDDQELNFKKSTQMTAQLKPSETGEWAILSGSAKIGDIFSPTTKLSDLMLGENIFQWTVSNGKCPATDTVVVRVNDMFIPEVITPNGDGKNDYFVVNDIERNSPAELVIFNRWGAEVYRDMNYSNNWDGRSSSGQKLNNDTYFYTFKFADGIVVKSFVVIRR